jgi:enediyne biosynthesis protein E4
MNPGRFSAAETILVGALSHPGRQAVTVGQVLARLLWEQGRTDERRAVIETNWRPVSQPDRPRPDEELGLLRDHIAVDFESLAVDAFRILLGRAIQQAPEDDRIWLAWANLAIQTGQFADACRRLDDCLGRRPEDPAVWQAVLDWGLGTEQVDQVHRALTHLPAERFSPSRVEALRAWLAARRHDAQTEQRALEQLVQERLAVLCPFGPSPASRRRPTRRFRR